MNLLNALAPVSIAPDPLEPTNSTRAQVALAVAAKVLDAQRLAGAQIVQLLDPNLGRNLDRTA
ncbi:MAG: hypothetical protein ACM3S1_03965 [Hyphomicrobiales bacterium]